MKQCFGYVRVSTQKQGDGVSLEAQRNAIEQFCARNDITIEQWFEEKQTAAKGGRPVFGAMLRLLKQGKAAGVVMHKIDRSARNFADWAKIGDLADAGIDVHFATETLDFRSRGGRLSADIQAVIAADYIRNLRDETLKGIYGRLKQGLYPWPAPIGYLDNGGGKTKTPDPARAPLIRELFNMYASGTHSIRSLQEEMATRGLVGGGGKPLTKTGVETVLSNPFYCGLMKVRRTGEVFDGCHEPLISSTLFERVQQIKRGKHQKRDIRHSFTYRRLFRCGHCHRAMTPERQKGHVYYRCQTRACLTKCVREEVLENLIQTRLSAIILTSAEYDETIGRVREWTSCRSEQATVRGLELEIARLEARLDALTDALLDGLIDKDTYTERKARLLLDTVKQRERLESHRRQGDLAANADEFLERVRTLSSSYEMANAEEKREIVEIAISNRYIRGEKPELEPSNWLTMTERVLSVLKGCPYRDTARTSQNMINRTMQTLVELMLMPETERMTKIVDRHFPRKASNDNVPRRDERGKFAA